MGRAIIIINLKQYAELMGLTRQAVHYQIKRGICSVQPIPDVSPPKWYLSDVDEYKRRVGGE